MNRYQRPHLAWVKRRARRLLQCFDVSRSEAVRHAAQDFHAFVGRSRPSLTPVRGGRV